MKTKIKELEVGDVIKLKKGTLLNFKLNHLGWPFYSRLMKKNKAEVVTRNDNSFGLKLSRSAITMYYGDVEVLELDMISSCRLPFKMNKGLKVKVLPAVGFEHFEA